MKSKKQLTISLLPEQQVLFLDRNMGSRIVAEWLRRLAVRVEVHQNHFIDTAADPEWITECAVRGWLIITCDRRIETNPTNHQAVFEAKAKVYILPTMRGEEWASLLVVCRSRMIDIANRKLGPFFVRLSRHGEVGRVRPASDKSLYQHKTNPSKPQVIVAMTKNKGSV